MPILTQNEVVIILEWWLPRNVFLAQAGWEVVWESRVKSYKTLVNELCFNYDQPQRILITLLITFPTKLFVFHCSTISTHFHATKLFTEIFFPSIFFPLPLSTVSSIFEPSMALFVEDSRNLIYTSGFSFFWGGGLNLHL